MAERRRRILVLAPFPPRLDARHGGSRAIAGLVTGLARRNLVAVACLRTGDEPPVGDYVLAACDRVLTWQRRGVSTSSVRPASRTLPVLLRFARGLPLWAAGRHEPGFARAVSALANAWRPDVLQIEYSAMAQYRDLVPSIPRVLTIHEPGIVAADDRVRESRGWRQRFWQEDARRWRELEMHALRDVDAAVIFTPRDRQALAALGSARRVVEVPLAIPVPPTPSSPTGTSPHNLLMVGNFVHPPNVDGARWFITDILPRVRERHSGAVLRVVGEGGREALGDVEGVEVMGWVENLAELLDRAAIVVAPLRTGGGMRVKVADALAAGKAIVGTSLAFEGLDIEHGRHALFADDAASFADATCVLLSDVARRASIASAARAWAVDNLGSQKTALAYESLYDSLVNAPAERTDPTDA